MRIETINKNEITIKELKDIINNYHDDDVFSVVGFYYNAYTVVSGHIVNTELSNIQKKDNKVLLYVNLKKE